MLTYLLLGFLAFAAIGWAQRNKLLRLPTWRLGAAALGIATFAAALYCGIRNHWGTAIVLAVIAAWLTISARHPRATAKSAPAPKSDGMSLADARSILGVGEGASPEDIKSAYSRLIQRVHPDVGGAAGLAAQLNIARDRLLKP